MSLLVKALLLLWPFLRRAIFGDRSWREVVVENKHVVALWFMIIILIFVGAVQYITLHAVKSENISLKLELAQVCPAPNDTLVERRALLGELLK